MKTILDECKYIQLDRIEYNDEGKLIMFLTELSVSDSKEEIIIGKNTVIKDIYRIEPNDECKHFVVEFEDSEFHQVCYESHCHWDENEKRDIKGFIQIITNSSYHQYIRDSFPFYNNLEVKGIHYRIITVGEIIDVISYEEPIVKNI